MLRIRGTDNGSFTAWGIGLHYEYNSSTRQLSIIHARHGKPVLDVGLDMQAETAPQAFVRYMEKATQIHALMLSNNRTIDITEILSVLKLQAYLENTLATAAMALFLENHSYEAFAEIFCDRYNIAGLQLSKIKANRISTDDLYVAHLETSNKNKVSSQGDSLHKTLYALSKTIVSDLLILEISALKADTHTLLTASTKLSTLSFLLNPDFEPRKRLIRKSSPPANGTESMAS